MTPKDNIKDKIRNMMEPYLSFDQDGLTLDKMSELGYYVYRANCEDAGRDFDENDFHRDRA